MQPHKFAEGEPLRASLEEFIIKMANSKNKTDEECSKLLTSGLVPKDHTTYLTL